MSIFKGLSAFPLTPLKDEKIDFASFERLIANLVDAKVDSICAMGSTGIYPYLELDEIRDVAQKAVEMSGNIPVIAGIGALRTKRVLQNAEAVQKAGVDAVLLAPVSYHPLNEDEVFSLYESVTKVLSVPLCIYENPRVTNFTFSDKLYEKVATLPNVQAIKIPGTPFIDGAGKDRLAKLRELLPSSVAIGVSGDQFGAAGMAAGCDLWLSVIGGLFPQTVKSLIDAASRSSSEALEASDNLHLIWDMFAKHGGGLRVIASAASILGYTEQKCLPSPLSVLAGSDKEELKKILNRLQLS